MPDEDMDDFYPFCCIQTIGEMNKYSSDEWKEGTMFR